MTNDLISLNLLSVNYKGICACELSLLYTTIYNPTQLSLVNLPFWITVGDPFAPSGQCYFKGPKCKMIILWLWFPAVHSSFLQGLWLLYWVFSKRWLFFFCSCYGNSAHICVGLDSRLMPGEMRWYMIDQYPGLETEAWCSIPSFVPYWLLDFSQLTYFLKQLLLVMFKSHITTPFF